MPTPSLPQHSRINLRDLKSRIVVKLGPERAQRYFNYLNQLLAQKVSKPEFNKHCLLVLGRENIPLHNQLVCSILRNVFLGKAPNELVHEKSSAKNFLPVGKTTSQGDIGSNQGAGSVPLSTTRSNGDILLSSPRKIRSGTRDRRIKDHPSTLVPNRWADFMGNQDLIPSGAAIKQNGTLGPCDLKRSLQHHQDGFAEPPPKRQRMENFVLQDQASVQSKSPFELAVAEDVEEVEQSYELYSPRSPLRAPLGIPFCPASVGGPRRSSPFLTCGSTNNFDSGELCHTEVLRERMEKIAEAQNMGGVSMDCANLLNNGLDAYLKRLVRSCIDLVGARTGHQFMKYPLHSQQPKVKTLNGVWQRNYMYINNCHGSSDGTYELKNPTSLSLQDFRVAMELNPQQLGEDWPLILEKVSFRLFDK
ncbi:uncharacterized protein [Typha latifolia]|uniref:uncharacterized protein n=1 Tax=Typha latifolia TaxID=4733 RepID=UPI003C2D5262